MKTIKARRFTWKNIIFVGLNRAQQYEIRRWWIFEKKTNRSPK